MTAVFQTKSNFKNCNGKSLEVVEIHNTRISALIPRYGFDKEGAPVGQFTTVADFKLSEVVSFPQLYKIEKK